MPEFPNPARSVALPTLSRFFASAGFTYVELLLALTLGALIMFGLGLSVTQVLEMRAYAKEKQALTLDAQFAMERMVRAVSRSKHLLIPPVNRYGSTSITENIRVETVPRTGLATAALVISMPASIDRDGNGKPDSDNDGDGRIDEDWPADLNRDGGMGIRGVDDNGDGIAIDLYASDDDEDSPLLPKSDEDPLNGMDDDGDEWIDEDPGADMNDDGAAGVRGVDDDGDGSTDEGAAADDDEDGASDEDWLDTVAFRISGTNLVERTPVPWDTDGNATVTGNDYIENPIASSVTRFRVERVAGSSRLTPLVDITLELTGSGGSTISLTTRVRIGSQL